MSDPATTRVPASETPEQEACGCFRRPAGTPRCRGRDRGSGSAAGIGLVALAAAGLFLAAVLGSAFIARSQAQTAADHAALAGAMYIQDKGAVSRGEACLSADAAARNNHADLTGCIVRDSDVTAETGVSPFFRFLPRIHAKAKAGPVDCVSRNG